MRPGYRTHLSRRTGLWSVSHPDFAIPGEVECEAAAEALADEHAAAMDQSDADEAAAVAAHDDPLPMKAAA